MQKNRYPHMQPFNINGNHTKKKSWWASPPYHNNGGKRGNSNAA